MVLRFLIAAILLLSLIACSDQEETLKIKRDVANIQEQIYQLERNQVEIQRDLVERMKTLDRKFDDRAAEADTKDQIHRVKQELSEYQALLRDLETKISDLRAANTRVTLVTERTDEPEGADNGDTGLENPMSGEQPDQAAITAVSGDVVKTQYNQAFLDYNRGKYVVAIDGFRGVLDNFPNSPYTEKAMYYLGSSLYQKENYQEAQTLFSDIGKKFPKGSYLKQSLYYEGRCYYAVGQLSRAIITLREVIDKYPGTQEADLANNFLKQSGYER